MQCIDWDNRIIQFFLSRNIIVFMNETFFTGRRLCIARTRPMLSGDSRQGYWSFRWQTISLTTSSLTVRLADRTFRWLVNKLTDRFADKNFLLSRFADSTFSWQPVRWQTVSLTLAFCKLSVDVVIIASIIKPTSMLLGKAYVSF